MLSDCLRRREPPRVVRYHALLLVTKMLISPLKQCGFHHWVTLKCSFLHWKKFYHGETNINCNSSQSSRNLDKLMINNISGGGKSTKNLFLNLIKFRRYEMSVSPWQGRIGILPCKMYAFIYFRDLGSKYYRWCVESFQGKHNVYKTWDLLI